jgi:hypothetical protein
MTTDAPADTGPGKTTLGGTDVDLGTPDPFAGITGDILSLLIGFAVAWCAISLGRFGASLLSVPPSRRYWGGVVIVGLLFYSYLKHVTRLRLENRRLVALDKLLESAGMKK